MGRGSVEALCILIVEDEALVRDILAEELVEAGFDVLQAKNGDEAATLIESRSATFTLLVTDIHMPGARSGLAVARLMRRRNPRVPVIYTTGRPDIFDGMGPLGENETILAKPFLPSELVRNARSLLGQER
jgi:DNA-binding response OmpR family regulator